MSGRAGPPRVRATRSGRVPRVLTPVLVGIAFLAGWEAMVQLNDIRPYLLPAPSAIWAQIVDNNAEILASARVTGANALVGLIAGAVLGILVALVASRFRVVDSLLVPLAAAVNAMPIIALAPIFNTMFSTTSSVPRRLVVTLVVFFPLFINALRGLRQVAPIHRELLDSYAAGGWTFARVVRIPNALPFIFTGLRLASSLAVIAAVVAEYFGGVQRGLGTRITSAASNTAYPRAWAYVAAACALGLVFYLAATLLERIAMPWRTIQPT
ncbi:MAG TPA: ABC transporter permease [Actinoplanes sp.]|nr:ABC transporter permease [Actinoplanes sp.]